MIVRKTFNLDEMEMKFDGESGRFSGYASVFGGVDSYGDTILKGAFEYTLRKHGKPKMFFNHDWSIPIGKYARAYEDDKGLYVEGEFTPNLSLSSDVRAAMKHGTLDGLSIGGFLKKGDYDETESGRVIRRWSHLVEVSPVVFPADSAARVEAGSVKGVDIESMLEGVDSWKDLERCLREAGGLSRAMATAVIAKAKVLMQSESAAADASNADTEDGEIAPILSLVLGHTMGRL